MQEFINLAMKQLGTTEENTKNATGGVLNFLAQHAPAGDVKELMTKLPGAEQLQSAAAAGSGSAGGMLGSLAGRATSALGGGDGAAMGLIGTLQGAGLDAGKAGSLVSLFVGFAREKAGADLVERITSSVPALAAMVR